MNSRQFFIPENTYTKSNGSDTYEKEVRKQRLYQENIDAALDRCCTVQKLDPAISKIGKEIVSSVALHPDFIKQLAKVAEVSVKKGYSPFNWIKENSPTRVSTFLSAAKRHLTKAELGEDFNIEKTLAGEDIGILVHHLDYAAYNLQMASFIIRNLREHDDRLFIDGELK